GVFRTTDGGANWGAANSGLTEISVGKPVIDPQNPGTIYVTDLTQIYKTTDGGSTWSQGAWGVPALYVRPNGLIIDPQSTATIYAGSADTDGSSGGVFKSRDGGKTWGELNSGSSPMQLCCIESLAIDPQ